jgi:hypothetical protein
MFHWKVEITSVATKGSCVTTMVKISAGSSGMRRRHLPIPEGVRGPTGGDAVLGGAVSVVMGLPPPEGVRPRPSRHWGRADRAASARPTRGPAER